MAVKAYINGSMKKITKHKMVTFVNGTKKHLPKGITFINGEKKILWQMGEIEVNAWSPDVLGYPNSYTIYDRIYGIEANDNKVIFNIDTNISRSDVSNLSIPYTEGTQNYGIITYRKENLVNNSIVFDANWVSVVNNRVPKSTNPRTGTTTYEYHYSATLSQNNVYIDSNMGITASLVQSSNKSGTSLVAWSTYKYPNTFYVNGTYGFCRITVSSGNYIISKNFDINNSTQVVSISAGSYTSSNPPVVWCYAIYNSRYILFGAEYRSSSSSPYVYSLKRIDLTNNSVVTILDNQPTPITAIMVDGNNLIVSANNKLFKMDINGTISDTYTSLNIMPTLVGKYEGYYYVTTTSGVGGRNYMNIEAISSNDFSVSNVKQTDIKMVKTYNYPYLSTTGFICFAVKSYVLSTVSGDQTTPEARSASMRETTLGTIWSESEVKVCRLQCY